MMVSERTNSSRGMVLGLVMLSLIAAGALLLPARPAAAVTYTITVHTDKQSYSGNQTIAVSGAVAPGPGANTGTVITIKNPSGVVVDISSVAVNGSTGTYSYSHVAGGTGDWVSGNYTVLAVWGGSGTQISATAVFAYSAQTVTSSTTTTTTSTTTTTTTTTPTTTCTDTVIVTTTQGDGTSTTSRTQTGCSTTTTTTTTSTTTTSTPTTTTTTTTTTSSNVPEFNSTSLLLVSLVTLSAVALLARTGFSFSGKKR